MQTFNELTVTRPGLGLVKPYDVNPNLSRIFLNPNNFVDRCQLIVIRFRFVYTYVCVFYL